MDSFEQSYVKGEGEVFFRDKIPVPKVLLLLSLVALIPMFLLLNQLIGVPAIPAAAFVFGLGGLVFFANLALMGIRTVLSEGGLDVFAGARKLHFALGDIEGAEVGKYRLRDYPLGRGVVRRGPTGQAFVSSLTAQGVHISLKGGKRMFLQSTDPEGLSNAIRDSITSKVRVDAAAETEPALEEVAADSDALEALE